MKRISKVFVFLALIMLMVVVLSACNSGKDYTGTYYAYSDGVKNEDSWIKLDKNSWTDDDGGSGRLEVKDGKIYGYVQFFGEEEVMFEGTVSDGAFRWTIGDGYQTFYKDGAYKGNENNGENDAPTKYTVTFDSCGGSLVESKEATAGSTIAAPEQPQRNMFIFSGWYKDSAYAEAWDFAEDTVDRNLILYARWTPDEVRIISLEGTQISGTSLTMIVDDEVNRVDLASKVVLNSNKATWKLYYDELGQIEIPTKLATGRDGILKSGSNVFYLVVTSEDGTQMKLYTLDVYKKYAVTVEVYGLSDETTPRETYTVYTLEDMIAPSDDITIVGYTITGWTSTGAEVGETVPKDSPFTVAMHAEVSPNKYKAIFDAAGGAMSVDEKQVAFNSHVNLGVPTRVGYTFLGWFADFEQISDENGVCEKWIYAEDKTLTAEWRAKRYSVSVKTDDPKAGSVSIQGNIDTVNLYFDANGVECANLPEMQQITKTEGMIVPEEPSAEGYFFRGWYKDKKCTEYFDFSKDILEDTTLYAGWWKTPALSYNGNIITEDIITDFGEESVQKVDVASYNIHRYFVASANYVFVLHYRVVLSDRENQASVKVYDVTNDRTGSLHWSRTVNNNSYSTARLVLQKGHVYDLRVCKAMSEINNLYFYLTKDADSNIKGGGKFVDGDIATGEECDAIVKLMATTNRGYIFTGWYDEDDLISLDSVYDASVPAKNAVYTAKWKLCTNHRINDYCECQECGFISHLPEKHIDGYCRHVEDGNEYIYFGYYPQTIKADDVTVGNTADSDGYYLGSDGERYTKVTAVQTVSLSDNITITAGAEYYFKLEVIKWRILDEKDGKALILCDSVVAESEFHSYEKSYAYSSSAVRWWLINVFYNVAFNSLQQELIQVTNVDNSVSTELFVKGGGCENTNDKVFLLSYQEVKNASYGFNSEFFSREDVDTARSMQVSDYGKAIGIYAYSNGNCLWWLRSSGLGQYSAGACCVYSDGSNNGSYPVTEEFGVVPAMWIQL